MKYITTESSILFYSKGATYIIDNTHDNFEKIKEAIINEKTEKEILYLMNKEMIDSAINLLHKTGGNLSVNLGEKK